jgi:hypothetical protein
MPVHYSGDSEDYTYFPIAKSETGAYHGTRFSINPMSSSRQ